MNKYREYIKDKTFARWSFFIVFTATLLYLAFFIVKDLNNIIGAGAGMLGEFISALTPLWIGLILAYLINPLVNTINFKIITKLKSPNMSRLKEKADSSHPGRLTSIVISYLLILFVIIALIYAFTWLIVGDFVIGSINELIDSLFVFISSYESEFRRWIAQLPLGTLSDYVGDALNTAIAWFNNNFSATGIIAKIAGISGAVFDFAIGLIISIYVLIERDFLLGLWNKFIYLLFPNKFNGINRTLTDIDSILSNFIRGVMIDALCVAILSSIGLSLMGLEFAVIIGVFAGICNVIPYFGPVIGMVPAFLVGFFTEGLLHGVIAVAILLLVQQIDSNLIYPRVVGSSTGLRPLFVLLAVTLGGAYGGILGMILAVPIAGISQIFIVRWANKREEILKVRQTFTENDAK